ncbi:MAG: hypothetical protein HGA80_03375 [Candidatus Omnitrophica bacterium]|nr:hypothetical protein [Candidatus Omnitrophota bacterium]
MMKSIGNVRRILQDNGISPAAVLSQDAGRSEALSKAYDGLPESSRKAFLREWWKLRQLELKYLQARYKVMTVPAALYAEIVNAMMQGQTEGQNTIQIGEKFPHVYSVAKDNKAKVVYKLALYQPHKKKTADHAQISPAKDAPYGGIDLTDGDGVDVAGAAGLFSLNLSPERVSLLKDKVDGFLPLVINVQEVVDVQAFLGVK